VSIVAESKSRETVPIKFPRNISDDTQMSQINSLLEFFLSLAFFASIYMAVELKSIPIINCVKKFQ